MAGIPWTDQEVDILKRMSSAGRSISDVTKVLKSRTVHSIECKAGDYGIRFSGIPEIDLDAFNQIMGGAWKQPEQG